MIGLTGYGAGDAPQTLGQITQPQNTGMNIPGLQQGGELWRQKFAQNPGWTTQQQFQGVDINGLMQGYNSQSEEQRRMAGGSYRSNGYDIAMGPGGYYQVGKAGIPGQGAQQHNGQYYDIYDPTGKYVGSNQYQGLGDKIGDLWDKAVPLATMAMIGGGVAGGFGYGPFAGGGAATGAPALTGVDAAMADLASAGGLTPAAMGGAGAAAAGGGGGGLLAQITSALGGSSGGTSLLSQLGSKLGSAGISALLNGGGGSRGSGGLSDLIGLIGGGVDAQRQGDAANKMLSWLNGNQAKMEGYMNPDSPEYKQLWEEMSRKDAAAGRNSQYGPRTADFMAKVASEKANNIKGFTTGTSRAYSDALNQNAAKYAGLSAAAQRAFGGNNGGSFNMSSLLDLFNQGYDMDSILNDTGDGWTTSSMSNDELDNWINGLEF